MTTIPNPPVSGDEFTNELTGVTYRYDGEKWLAVSAPGNEALDALTVRVADGETVQSSIQGEQITQNESIESIEAEQTVQDSQINALETQIQLLSGVKAVGRWTYRRRVETNGPRPPATATFYGTHKDGFDNVLLNWSDTYLLMINKIDIEGNNFTFSDFEEGDKVEIIATDGSSAVYGTITNNPSNDVYGNMVIDVERFRGGPVEEKEYLISAYRPGSSNGNVDLDILDDRYLVKTGDQMTGELNIDKSSGTALKISKDGQNNLKFWADGTAETTKTTFADSNFVTKAYVDEIAASPAHLQWQYNGTVNNSNDPGNGNMVWNPKSNSDVIGYLRFSFVTLNGQTDLGYEKFDDTNVSLEYGPIGTVWQWRSDIKKWKLMVQFRAKRLRWNYNNHFELALSSKNGTSFEDIANAAYFVTFGGFF